MPRLALRDDRLLQYAKATRRFLVLTVGLGGVTGLLVVAQAFLIATIVSGAVVDHRSLGSERSALIWLLLVVCGRATVAWGQQVAATRTSASAKSEIRGATARTIGRLGPEGLERHETGRLVVLATDGLDALDKYFSSYLPQLFLAVIVPLLVILVIAGADWVSALIIVLTVPFVPIFMGLVGMSTGEATARRMGSLQRLAGHFLDVVSGLPTLKIFGRAKEQAKVIRDVSERYRSAAMATLRLTFLSSLVLELVATISVALVAVSVGLRLLTGHMSFRAALFALILAPEAYQPLRQLGANFHASADGLRASEEAFDIIDGAVAESAHGTRVPSGTRIEASGIEVRYSGRGGPALKDLDLVVEPGETVAITGPSGCGKTTLVNLLLGFREPSAGRLELGGVEASELDIESWRKKIAWVPQRPHLFACSVEDNVKLGRPSASEDEVMAALTAVGLESVVARLPMGIHTRIGQGGAQLSTGERHRVAIARALVRDAELLLFDEPTANLDAHSEAQVIDAIGRSSRNRTAIVVTHRPGLAGLADRMVVLRGEVVQA